MTHRGPFQPVPFCDSENVFLQSISSAAGAWDLVWLREEVRCFGTVVGRPRCAGEAAESEG